MTSAVDDAPWDYFDVLRSGNSATSRSADLVDATVVDNNGTELSYMLRSVACFIPLLVAPGGTMDQVWLDSTAATLLAIYHFNNGFSQVTPEIANVVDPMGAKKCKIRLTAEVHDDRHSPIYATEQLIRDIIPRKQQSALEWNPELSYPTALLGAVRSSVSVPMATIGGVNQLLQVSAVSTSSVLDNKDQYPYFARVITSVVGDATAAVEYLINVLGVTHLGIFYVRDDYGTSYALAIQAASEQHDRPMSLITSSIVYQDTYPDVAIIDEALRPLVESGFHYFFVLVFDVQYTAIMPRVTELGIAGPGYFWITGRTFPNLDLLSAINDTRLATAVAGTGVILGTSPEILVGGKGYDNFIKEWNEKIVSSSKAFAFIQSKLPKEVISADIPTYKPSPNPAISALRHYDAVIAIGLAMCQAQALEGDLFTPNTLRSALLNLGFGGTDGTVAFDNATGTRDYRRTQYTLKNVVLAGLPNNSSSTYYNMSVTHVYSDGIWNTFGPDFVYSDGTATPPLVLPPLQHKVHLIAPKIQIIGFVLCGISVLLSLGWLGWTYYNRNTKVIKASQPEFLAMLCIGAFIMGVSIFTLGLQEPVHQASLDKACMAFPWLFSVGFVIAFSALFTKTRRINKIFLTRSHLRIKVLPRDVLGPFLVLLFSNLVILIAWTVVSPLTYQQKYMDSTDQFGRLVESYGRCWPADVSWADYLFVSLILIVDVGVLVYANYEAYQARTVNSQYTETRYIAISMAIILQSALLGIPVIILVQDVPSARYFVVSCFVFIICLAVLLPMFLPKLRHLNHDRRDEKIKALRRATRLRSQEELFSHTNNSLEALPSDSVYISRVSDTSGLRVDFQDDDVLANKMAKMKLSWLVHENSRLRDRLVFQQTQLIRLKRSIAASQVRNDIDDETIHDPESKFYEIEEDQVNSTSVQSTDNTN